ncbi:MAG: hypothetical protein WAM04_13530 [Candidatus Sulfotelmatobacter sp.]
MPESANNEAAGAVKINVVLQSFLGDVDSLREVFDLVVPLLEQQDEQRRQAYKSARETLQNGQPSGDNQMARRLEAAKAIRVHGRKLRRGKVQFQSNSIVSLISRFDQLFASLLRVVLRTVPQKLEAATISYKEAAAASSIQDLRNRFVGQEVEAVMRGSHQEQFKYMEPFTGPIDEPKLWAAFIEVVERRNLHVHAAGRVSSQYLEVCKAVGAAIPVGLKLATRLPIDRIYFDRAVLILSEMGIKLSQTVSRKIFPKHLDIADGALMSIGLSLLQAEQDTLAEIVFDYAVSLKKNWVSSENMSRAFLINKATALNFNGEGKKSLALLDTLDWSAAHPKFLLAVSILRGDYDHAEKILDSLLKSGELTQRNLLEWPVFREFRLTARAGKYFQSAKVSDDATEEL